MKAKELVFLCLIGACSQENTENASTTKDLSNAMEIKRVDPGSDSWEVTCSDGRKETKSSLQVEKQDYCAFTRCQTKVDCKRS